MQCAQHQAEDGEFSAATGKGSGSSLCAVTHIQRPQGQAADSMQESKQLRREAAATNSGLPGKNPSRLSRGERERGQQAVTGNAKVTHAPQGLIPTTEEQKSQERLLGIKILNCCHGNSSAV